MNEKIESIAQRRLFGMAWACRKDPKNDVCNIDSVKKLADSKITDKDLRKHAKKKEKDLPERVGESFVLNFQQFSLINF